MWEDTSVDQHNLALLYMLNVFENNTNQGSKLASAVPIQNPGGIS